MLDGKTIKVLVGWVGYRVERVACPEDGGRPTS